MLRRKRETSDTKNIIFIGIVIFAFIYLCIYLCILKDRADEIEANRETNDDNIRTNIVFDSEVRTEFRFHQQHPNSGDMFVVTHQRFSSPSGGSVIIELPITPPMTTANSPHWDIPDSSATHYSRRADSPPSYEECPSYDESLRNMEHWKKLQNKK